MSQGQGTDPLKLAAYVVFHKALRDGLLVRPEACGECGKPCTPQGHHADYAQPLHVAWLCPACHRAKHPGPRGPRRPPLPARDMDPISAAILGAAKRCGLRQREIAALIGKSEAAMCRRLKYGWRGLTVPEGEAILASVRARTGRSRPRLSDVVRETLRRQPR